MVDSRINPRSSLLAKNFLASFAYICWILIRYQAAIDDVVRAGAESGLVGGKEEDEVCHFVRLSHSAASIAGVLETYHLLQGSVVDVGKALHGTFYQRRVD